jgi:hypothetical protein
LIRVAEASLGRHETRAAHRLLQYLDKKIDASNR